MAELKPTILLLFYLIYLFIFLNILLIKWLFVSDSILPLLFSIYITFEKKILVPLGFINMYLAVP